MEFCPICPTKLLDRLAGDSSTHLVLANFYGRDGEYAEWYRGRVKRGDTVILDNGAYEGELVEPRELLRVVLDLQPTVVVLPDCPGDYRATWRMGMDFACLLDTARIPVQKMQVVHAQDGDLRQFEEAFNVFSLCREWVGLSRLTGAYGLPGEKPALRRVQFIEHLKRQRLWRKGLKCHCLGLLNGQMEELVWLAGQGVQSLDSSAPIWRGLRGLRVEEPCSWNSWQDVPFDPTNSEGCVAVAERNLQIVRRLCRA